MQKKIALTDRRHGALGGRGQAPPGVPPSSRGAKLLQAASTLDPPELMGPPGKRTRGARERLLPTPEPLQSQAPLLSSATAGKPQDGANTALPLNPTDAPPPRPMSFLHILHFAIAVHQRV